MKRLREAPTKSGSPNDCNSPSRASAVMLCSGVDRKSTRLNSSHSQISYAVFCLKKKKKRCRSMCKHEVSIGDYLLSLVDLQSLGVIEADSQMNAAESPDLHSRDNESLRAALRM